MRGFTQRHPDVPPALRGTYAGLSYAAGDRPPEAPRRHGARADAGARLRRRPAAGRARPAQLLGLQHASASSRPSRATAPRGNGAASSRRWCKTLHAAGIEVILDVVYNHTAEGNQLGPTLSFRGIDNAAYYRLVPDDAALLPRTSPAAATRSNMQHPRVLQLVMDSLRYWVTEMHVDGFRFDLASTLARELHEVDRLGAFFDVLRQDPVLSRGQADRRALGPRRGRLPGRQLPGRLGRVERPVPRHDARLLEGRRRADRRVRAAPHRLERPLRAAAAAGPTRASTSSPRTTASRWPTSSPTTTSTTRPTARTTATAHDNNLSWNCGVEGPTDDPEIIALRARQKRNLLATLLLSQGVPMLLAGDEIGRTPAGQQQRLLPGQRDSAGSTGRWTTAARSCSSSRAG